MLMSGRKEDMSSGRLWGWMGKKPMQLVSYSPKGSMRIRSLQGALKRAEGLSCKARFGLSLFFLCGLAYRHCAERGHSEANSLTVYLRFRNSFVPSISVTYWNPFSISCAACLMLSAVLHVHSSSSRFNSCTYTNVVSIFL